MRIRRPITRQRRAQTQAPCKHSLPNPLPSPEKEKNWIQKTEVSNPAYEASTAFRVAQSVSIHEEDEDEED